MKKEYYDSYFRKLLADDGIDPNENKYLYECRSLTKTDKKTKVSVEYGFSIFVFGVLALRSVYNGKWSTFIEITRHCQKVINVPAESYGDGETYHVMISTNNQDDLLNKIYGYCRNNAKKEFDCCSRFLECSDALECVNPCKARSIVCGYRKKLEQGIVFYGKNANKASK